MPRAAGTSKQARSRTPRRAASRATGQPQRDATRRRRWAASERNSPRRSIANSRPRGAVGSMRALYGEFHRVARHRAVVARALDRIFERAVLAHRRQRNFEVAVDDFAPLQRASPEFAIFGRTTPERKNHWQRDLAFAEIVA